MYCANFTDNGGIFPDKKISLGLDLKGGIYVVLGIDFNQYINEKLEQLPGELSSRYDIKENQISLNEKDDTIKISLSNNDESLKFYKEIKKDRSFNVKKTNNNILLSYTENFLKNSENKIIENTISNMQHRLDQTGTKEISLQRYGENKILLQIPGIDDTKMIKNLIGKTAKLSFHLINEDYLLNENNNAKLPIGTIWMKDRNQNPFPVYKKSLLSGEMLLDTEVVFGGKGGGAPAIKFQFNKEGSTKFAKITTENTKKPLAIVLDKEILTMPTINEPIRGGMGEISGKFSLEEAKNMAIMLRSGALAAPVTILEERIIGASLGKNSINIGIKSGIIALILISSCMVVIYRVFGLFSICALFINIVILLAMLTLLEATLTFPGIAGIILTIGMAVDANVLIFERIKEEKKLADKKPDNLQKVYAIIQNGFKGAMKTILDSNITTVIAAIIMFSLGSGPIKG
ncbi:MAG: protein translocase subunit SecD, partial [Anaplasmataceae bacterium]|nr:protein translocase subunit SecD [Anaplasmataceae bacterium]